MKKINFKLLVSAALAGIMLVSAVSCSKGSKDREPMMDGELYYQKYGGGTALPGEMPEEPTNEAPSEPVFIENAYISASVQPVSTFSSDVDTASYALFRKLVNSGASLANIKKEYGGYIRTEEMINYFKYNYNTPVNGELFGVTTELSDCPWNSEAKLLTIGLQAEATVAAVDNNLVFLIDVSGSMNSDDKLGLVKTAFSKLTESLDAGDRISIVTYAGKDSVVLDGCHGDMKSEILGKINNLTSGGSTNGASGITTAYRIAEENYISGGNNRIILASDGDFNVGLSSVEELKRLITTKRENGIFFSAMGFGYGNYRDSVMETLADNGNGVYYYIDGVTEANKVFGDDLRATLYTIAKDTKLQLTFNGDVVDSYRLVGYENRLLSEDDFNDDTKDAGDVGAGHSVTACYELILKEAPDPENSADIAKLAVRYKKTGESSSTLDEYGITTAAYAQSPSDNFRFISSVAEFSLILHDSKYLADSSDVGAVINTLKALGLADNGDFYKREFLSLLEKAAG